MQLFSNKTAVILAFIAAIALTFASCSNQKGYTRKCDGSKKAIRTPMGPM